MPTRRLDPVQLLCRLLTAACLGGIATLALGCGLKDRPVPTTKRPTSGRTEADRAQPSIREVRVAAAADLKFALAEVIEAFGRRASNVKVIPTFGSSGNFFAQLTNEAPFDLFLSADIGYPRKLIEQGQGIADSEFLYAVGHLVVWVRNDSPLDVARDGIRALADPQVKKIAIANPRVAPYGKAAEAALKSLGVYESIESRLVLGENIAQTAQFVESGGADAGVIALSLALSPMLRDKGRYWEVPADAHPPLEQGGVILKWAQDADAAREFCAFLRGNEGQAILTKFGFFLPGE
jgi:molybdate transport system substrate-binding protein